MRSTRSVRSVVAALAVAVGVFGLSFGVLAVAAGLTPVAAVAMSLFVFAGGAQFAAVGVIAAGGGPIAAVASGLLLNTRYAPFGIAIAPSLAGGRLRRALAAHLVIDESVALVLSRRGDGAERLFFATGLTLGAAWITGTAVGALAGSVIGDPAAFGLDVAFPAGFLALLAPLLGSRRRRAAATGGVGIAVVLLPFALPGVPVLAAGLGALVALAVPESGAVARPGATPADDREVSR